MRTGGIFYFPCHRHQIEGTGGFECFLRNSLARRGKRNCQSSKAKLSAVGFEPVPHSPFASASQRSNPLGPRAPVYCTLFCARDDKYAHDYSHGNNLHALKTWSECMHMHARKTCKQLSKYNYTCVLTFVMKTSTIYSTVFCVHDDKYVPDYSHGNNLHALITWSECMHMHARKTCKQLSKYNYTCVLTSVMKTSTIYSTVFCAHDDKYVHDYSHGNNLHALKTRSECMHMYARKTCKQLSRYNYTCVLTFVMKTSTI